MSTGDLLSSRATQWDGLTAALDACRSGTGQIVLIEAPAGCGKSELLATFADHAAARGATVLQAAGTESDRDTPFSTLRRLSTGTSPVHLPFAAEAAPPGPDALHEVWAGLLGRAAGAPVVCCVDALHYADAASLESLLHLIRLSRAAPVLMVLSQAVHFAPYASDFGMELLRLQNLRHLRLDRLGPDGVREVVARYPELAATEAELGRISGGNPLLLRALIAERRSSVAGIPAAGGPFAQAVVTCARRSGRHGLRLAGGVAVLGAQADPDRLADLLGITPSAVAQGLAAMAASGILDDTGFRHPVGRTAVLDHLPRTELVALHRRAAELLHAAGSPPRAVARHLVASLAGGGAGTVEPWAVEVLRSAAEHELAGDDPERAAHLLEHAHGASPDRLRRGEIKTRLAAITWRLDPARSERHLDDAVEALTAADATEHHVWPLSQLLVAQGRIATALQIRDRVRAGTAPGAADAEEPGADGAGERPATLVTLLDSNAADLERYLESTALSGPTMPALNRAVASLAHSHDPRRAVHWSRTLLEQAELRDARGWRFAFTSTLAFAQLRLGDLREAERLALEALGLVPSGRGCLFTYSAVATLIRARTEMRDFAAAAVEVDQPLPAKLFHTVHGLHYLRARGRYLAATGQPHAALGDFFEAGRIMKRWNLDRPILLPWRTEAAEVLRHLGETTAVERLVLHQLSTTDARHPWVRGLTLRLRAATSDPRKRSLLLQQAVTELRKSGDRVELARTLADLGEALQAVQDPVSVVISQQAVTLATECGADALLEDIRHRSPGVRRFEPGANPAAGAAEVINARLSESERRVAALAALKYTNREISRLLHVTVSTVEQHLTNVYRKLHIEGRRNLPANLDLYPVETA